MIPMAKQFRNWRAISLRKEMLVENPAWMLHEPYSNGSKANVTLVTALYDIGRENQGRPMSVYLEWMENTLRLQYPFIIFTSAAIGEKIRQFRNNSFMSRSHLVVHDYIPLQEFSHMVENEVFPSFKMKMKHKNDIVNQNPLYSIIGHAKLIWMSDAIRRNPFHTGVFLWIDAGFSRFIQQQHYRQPCLSQEKLNTLLRSNKVYLPVNSPIDKVRKDVLAQDVFGANENFFRGGMWGGAAKAVYSLATTTLGIFFDGLAKKMIDTEQVTVFLAYQRSPSICSPTLRAFN